MTIRKGEPWGAPGPRPDDLVVVRSDAEARAVVSRALADGAPIPTLGLLGGDLCKTVGGHGDEARLDAPEVLLLPVDLGTARLDDGPLRWFVAHAVARRGWWRGQVVAAMNAQWIGRWDVAPRSHPNDGLLDVFDGNLSFDDRTKARSRLLTGTHVPHPGISQRRVSSVVVELDRPADLHLDGEKVGRGRRLELRLLPDAATVVV